MPTMTRPRAKRLVLLMAVGLASLIGLAPVTAKAAEKPKTPAPAAPAAPAREPRPTPPAEAPYPALEAVEREVARMVETARPSVVGVIARSRLNELLDALGESVRIEGRLERSQSGPMAKRVGSGVVIDSKGHIVTLASVVSGAAEISVVSFSGQRIPAKLKGLDDESGIAVLVLDEPASLRPIRFGDSDTLKPGALITTFSSASGDPGGAPAYSLGFVSGMGVSLGPLRRGSYLKLNAHSAPGGGGGPVLDKQGLLAGIVFGGGDDAEPGSAAIRWIEKPRRAGKAPIPPDEPEAPDEDVVSPDQAVRILRSLHRSWGEGSGVSYAVPGNVVRRVSDQIIESGYVKRGWVGVRIEEDEPGEIDLVAVVPGSPAETAGLRTGDRIVSYGIGTGSLVTLASSAVLVDQIASSAPGATLRLGILRDNTPRTMTLVLGEAPRAAARHEGRLEIPRLHAALMRMARPTLGVEIDQEASEETLRALGAKDGAGLLILKVYDDSRAEEAGLRAGDLIVEAMGVPLTTLESLRQALRAQGDRVMPMKVLRDRHELTLSIQPLPIPPPPEPPPEPPPPRNRQRAPGPG